MQLCARTRSRSHPLPIHTHACANPGKTIHLLILHPAQLLNKKRERLLQAKHIFKLTNDFYFIINIMTSNYNSAELEAIQDYSILQNNAVGSKILPRWQRKQLAAQKNATPKRGCMTPSRNANNAFQRRSLHSATERHGL